MVTSRDPPMVQSPRVRDVAAPSGRDPALVQLQAAIASREKDIRELRRQNDATAAQYDRQIKEARDLLIAKTQQASRLEALQRGEVPPVPRAKRVTRPRPQEPARAKGGPVLLTKPGVPMQAHIPIKGDEIDNRLADVYNQTSSAVPFKRINKGCYLFGTQQVEVSIINHKPMVRADEGWNRGNFGPLEKFLHANENVEREKLRIPLDP